MKQIEIQHEDSEDIIRTILNAEGFGIDWEPVTKTIGVNLVKSTPNHAGLIITQFVATDVNFFYIYDLPEIGPVE